MLRKIKYDGNVEKIIDIIRSRFEIDEKYEVIVKEILKNVKERKDEAMVEYIKKFDAPNFSKENIKVTPDEIKGAYAKVEPEFINAIKKAKANIEKFHKKQLRESWNYYGENGEILGMKITPLQRVGLYVPGGKGGDTPLVSTVLMNAVPAKVAGVEEVVMVTPPNDKNDISPYLMVTADIAGVSEIYRTGSAWGVGALCYGTESIKGVDKIVGPGNIYVTVAKKLVYGKVDIDMIAGPSEILVIADKDANPVFTAADLLSQAEHDTLAASILITDSEEFADKTIAEVEKQIKSLSRREIAEKSLQDNGLVVIVDKLDDAFTVSNEIAPEHLELEIENPFSYISKVKNAGAIFLGKYTPEPLGDYFAGPNHVLPTNMTAKFYSPLNVDNFIKKTSILYYPEELLLKEADDIIRIAEVEGLTAHANSIRVRKK